MPLPCVSSWLLPALPLLLLPLLLLFGLLLLFSVLLAVPVRLLVLLLVLPLLVLTYPVEVPGFLYALGSTSLVSSRRTSCGREDEVKMR